eukprot:CAMPEP_0202903574 /NCGR_PEP_ID=MMETSP1392-20130828/25217_1 /ASSEMBLY_ACC=CAM_ASM_000868 /TAXON_ID=225041 /ORGANISM="Chlamydomonas chlamydogama, Strain SAG 11-48b" /LENGTH=48 /DNA_ID= /DNA_START= /DNA_END= /DNA_ORIENTATION=
MRQRIMLHQQAAHLITALPFKAPERQVPVPTGHGVVLQQQRHNLRMAR